MRQPDKFQHVAAVRVHGINMSQLDNFDPFVERVRNRLPRAMRTYATFRNVFWTDIVRGRQKDYIRQAQAKHAEARTPVDMVADAQPKAPAVPAAAVPAAAVIWADEPAPPGARSPPRAEA